MDSLIHISNNNSITCSNKNLRTNNKNNLVLNVRGSKGSFGDTIDVFKLPKRNDSKEFQTSSSQKNLKSR